MRSSTKHIIVWLLFMLQSGILDWVYLRSDFSIVREMVVWGIEIWIFYSFYLSLKSINPKNKRWYWKSLLYITVSVGGTLLLNHFRGIIGKMYGYTLFPDQAAFIADTIIFFIQFGIYSIGFYFAERSVLRQKQLRLSERKELEREKENLALKNNYSQLQQEKLMLEKELLVSENNFLRAQINPHFLYNCLNFFFAQTFEKQPEVGEGILTLAQIMRYSMNDHRSSGGLARLTEETMHIENVIKMYQMRFGDELQIAFTKEGDMENKQVTPMVFMTLVENVFKHGNLHDKQNPAQLSCTVLPATAQVQITTFNKKKRGLKEPGTGVGLSNTIQRLTALYKDTFSIQVTDEPDDYRTVLVMPYFTHSKTSGPAASNPLL